MSARRARAMGRGSACFAAGLVAAATLTIAAPHEALADAKAECAAAYEQTQVLRAAGKLVEARKQATACAAQACPDFLLRDCTRWLGEIQESTPTVVFAAQDRAGADTTAVRVTLDGVVVGDTLDGKAVALNPGVHTVHFDFAGSPPIEQQIVVAQGEHDRRVAVSFRVAAAEPAPPLAPIVTQPVTPQRRVVPKWAWAVGGVGVVLVLAGAGVLVGSAVEEGSLNSACGGNARACPPADVPAATPKANTRNLLRIAGGVLGGVGVVGVVVGAIGIASAKLGPSGSGAARGPWISLAPLVGSSSAGAALRGSF